MKKVMFGALAALVLLLNSAAFGQESVDTTLGDGSVGTAGGTGSTTSTTSTTSTD